MPAGHLISRVTILGTGLIGGSFALALRKYTNEMYISGWDRAEVIREAQALAPLTKLFPATTRAMQNADLIFIALPIAATLDLLPEIARHAPSHALITDACSTKVRIANPPQNSILQPAGRSFSVAIPWPVGNAPASPTPTPISSAPHLALIGAFSAQDDPRVFRLRENLEKIGARPLWLGAQQHDYAVGLASHLPQLAAVALAGFYTTISTKTGSHHSRRSRPSRLAAPCRQPLFHLARHRTHQPGSPLRRARSLRPPP